MNINESTSMSNKSIDEVKQIVKSSIEDENVALSELKKIVDIMIDVAEAPRSASRKIKDVTRGLHLMKPFMEMMQSSKDIIMKGTLDINMKQKILEKIDKHENGKNEKNKTEVIPEENKTEVIPEENKKEVE